MFGYEQANQQGTKYDVVLDDKIICTCNGVDARSMAHEICFALNERNTRPASEGEK